MKHPVYDTDLHFTIDPTTRALIAQMKKLTLVQGSHNSERFTFDFPRMVEGHDLSLCDLVEVHFLNIDAITKETSPGTYGVDDVQVCEEDDQRITFSWLIDGRATKFGGTMSFSIHFKCMGDGKLLYRWPTAIFSGILISDGIDHGEAVMEDYTDIVAAWMSGIEQSIDVTVSEAVNKAVEENVSDAVDKAVDATVGDAVDKAIEDAINNSEALKIDTSNIANAITGYASGTSLQIDDLSPLASKVKVNVVGKQPPETPAMMMMRSAAPTATGNEFVNLMPFTTRSDGELGYQDLAVGKSKTVEGVTFLVNKNGSITISGKSKAFLKYTLYENKNGVEPFAKGTYYTVYGEDSYLDNHVIVRYENIKADTYGYSFISSITRSGKISDEATGVEFYFTIEMGTDFGDGLTLYPMIVEGEKVNITEYVPPIGATADGGDHTHIDDNKDHKCDICGEQISACYDNNKDHKCDYCGAALTDHLDDDGNGYCDHCGTITHTHTDADNNHRCDVCGEVVSGCTDANLNHLCDKCGEYLGEHRDADGDGLCDYCHQPIDEVVTPLSVKVQTASADDPETIVETVVTVAGAIVELTPIFPAMIIKTDSEEVLLSAEYNKDTNKVVAELEQEINERDVYNITSIDIIYSNVDDLPLDVGNGTCYVVANSDVKALYAFVASESKWNKKIDLKPHTIYVVLTGDKAGLYRYTMSAPYLVSVESHTLQEAKDYADSLLGNIYDLVITSDEEFSKCVYALVGGSANTEFEHKNVLVKDVTFKIQRGSNDLDLQIFQPSIKYIKFENCRWETEWWVSGKVPTTLASGGTQYERAPGNFDLVIDGIEVSADNVQAAKDAGVYWYIGLRNIKALINSTVRYPEGYDISDGWNFKLTCQYFDYASNNHVPALWDGANVSNCYIIEKLVRCSACANITSAPVMKDGAQNPVTVQTCANLSNFSGLFTFSGCDLINATLEDINAAKEAARELYVQKINRSDNYAGLFLYGVDKNGVQKHYHARTSPGASEVPVTNASGTLQTTWEDYDKFDNYNTNGSKWPKSALMPKDYIDRAIKKAVDELSARIAALESKITG